jgi:hypothetical protein
MFKINHMRVCDDWAKKVMVKVWDVDGLIDNQVEHSPGLSVIIGW